MRTALILLFLLALGSIPGSVLPQQGADPSAVQQYYAAHPGLAPWLNHLGLFNVFAAPWFAAIYLLLFTSLVGCVVPRTFKLAGAARTPPPRAPRNLARLPHSSTYTSALPSQDAVEGAASVLGGQRFRLRRSEAGGSEHWVSAEKGYLREAGNLLFHLSLLGVLVSIAAGGLFGYKADKLLVEGQPAFADTVSALDEFHPGRLVSGSDLAPFSLALNKFTATYLTSGESRGQPADFNANVTYTSSPGAKPASYNIRINDPLPVDGAKVYLIGHGYAPEFKVTGADGTVAYDEATPFIPANTGTFLSDGVIKAPDASLGFMGVFVPTAISVGGTLESIFPAADNPAVSLIGYSGNLGMNSGVPQSVYQLDTTGMTKLSGSPHLLQPGQTWQLPGGKGSITFVGVKQWVSIAITYDPGQVPALVCGILALAGLLLSFFVRRRRVFVRAVPAESGTGSVVTVGGLTRSDASGGFEEEFAELAAEIAAAESGKHPEEGA
ncbi:cytochrome c biogenesis protein ResB [Trebonia kvetii]|uniref:Cytochrome c biogenesis protein ResB n=2 Tax=Trebonia kvetii TaxID=2480626 RepID=A0A6P2BSJ5_9ACTN|nr:cytochrome c biogenesis protein ResB [Trebonia kvetii]